MNGWVLAVLSVSRHRGGWRVDWHRGLAMVSLPVSKLHSIGHGRGALWPLVDALEKKPLRMRIAGAKISEMSSSGSLTAA
jgi:hypothetical protein